MLEYPAKKALTQFPVPDEILHGIQSHITIKSLNDLWNPRFLEKYPQIFACKLIPLNKNHPKVPSPTQMRPIVVTNSLFKLLEVRLNKMLTEKFNLLPKLSESQIGFLKGMSTQVNIKRLLDYITQPYYHDRDKPGAPYVLLKQPFIDYPLRDPNLHTYIIYVDYEQAYGSIDMAKLYNRMKNMKYEGHPMFPDKDLAFIFWAYQQIVIQLGNEIIQPKFGVPPRGPQFTHPI